MTQSLHTSSPCSSGKLSPHTLSAALLVAGTCIGGGMLALPVACAQAGFMPSIGSMALTWFMMTMTALCLVEVGFWMDKDDAHIVSMSKKLLGPIGRWVSWGLFLFISYASLVAYTGGSGQLIANAISMASKGSISLSHEAGCLIFTLFFGPFIFLSHYTLGKANTSLFMLMIVVYLFIIGIGISHVDVSLLSHINWSFAPTAIPLLLTSFSFQTMVPSLHPYLHHDKRSLRVAIISGTMIAFAVYALWQFVVMGSVPLEGSYGLLEAYKKSEPATYSLGYATNNQSLSVLSTLFAFLSLVTSFFGISMGLYDFLSDGLNIDKKGRGTLILGSLVLLPSLYFAIRYEGVFLTALDLSGGFGDTILNGIIPIAMIWAGWKIYKTTRFTKRLKIGLLFLASLYTAAFLYELSTRIEFGDTAYDNKAVDIIEMRENTRP